jgi:hypothetical protein
MKRSILAAASIAAALVAPSVAFAWGAISVSDNGRNVGYAHSYDTERAASRRASSECGGCGWVVTFSSGCAAYAQDSSGSWGWSRGESRADAERGAKRQCRSNGGSGCTIRVWACD